MVESLTENGSQGIRLIANQNQVGGSKINFQNEHG